MSIGHLQADRNEPYYEWLMDQVGYESEYSELLFVLYDIPFTWVIELDSNRASDGYAIRKNYMDNFAANESKESRYLSGRDCSVFEALLGIAERFSFLIEDEDVWWAEGSLHAMCFWKLIENLGLDWFTNDYIYSDIFVRTSAIEDIIYKWLSREFEPDGTLSPFPLKFKSDDLFKDQRAEPIMGQLNSYVLQRFNT